MRKGTGLIPVGISFLSFFLILHASAFGEVPPPYSVMIGSVRYGASADARGPIGGGAGYADLVATGDYVVRNAQQLVDALAIASPGEIIFIPGNGTIEFDGNWSLPLRVPDGVTLAGARGQAGIAGAVLRCADEAADPFILIDFGSARITGLRIRGPDPDQHRDIWNKAYLDILPKEGSQAASEYFYSFPFCKGVLVKNARLEFDNCEISGWSHSGVFLTEGGTADIIYCHIHSNQRHGFGYGICVDTGIATITHNYFEDNRHSIAGTGNPEGSYLASDNVELGCTLEGLHRFDMHGTAATKDGFPVAGGRIVIRNNTFITKWLAINIRGRPRDEVDIRNNIFFTKTAEASWSIWPATDNFRIFDNLYDGRKYLKKIKVKRGK